MPEIPEARRQIIKIGKYQTVTAYQVRANNESRIAVASVINLFGFGRLLKDKSPLAVLEDLELDLELEDEVITVIDVDTNLAVSTISIDDFIRLIVYAAIKGEGDDPEEASAILVGLTGKALKDIFKVAFNRTRGLLKTKLF